MPYVLSSVQKFVLTSNVSGLLLPHSWPQHISFRGEGRTSKDLHAMSAQKGAYCLGVVVNSFSDSYQSRLASCEGEFHRQQLFPLSLLLLGAEYPTPPEVKGEVSQKMFITSQF